MIVVLTINTRQHTINTLSTFVTLTTLKHCKEHDGFQSLLKERIEDKERETRKAYT